MDLDIIDCTHLLLNISSILFVVVFILFILKLKNNKYNLTYKIITFNFFFLAVLQISFRLSFNFSFQNWILTNVFLVGQMFIASFFFISLIKTENFKIIIKLLFLIYVIFTLVQYIANFSMIYNINRLGSIIASFFIIIYTLMFLYESLGKKRKFYYICIGGMVYHFSSFTIFLTFTIFYDTNKYLGLLIYNSHTVLAVVFALFALFEWKVNILSKTA